jgi:hypothetical protein
LDEGGGTSDPSHSLLQFLHCLRALLRRAYAVAMVTIPTHLMKVTIVWYSCGYETPMNTEKESHTKSESKGGNECIHNSRYNIRARGHFISTGVRFLCLNFLFPVDGVCGFVQLNSMLCALTLSKAYGTHILPGELP